MTAEAASSTAQIPQALVAENLCKDFSPHKQLPVRALDRISFTIDSGRVTGLVGPDGAGKTTLLRLAAGLLLPTSGNLRVLGHDQKDRLEDIQRLIGYMPQQFGLYHDLSVQENLDLFSDLQGVARQERPHQHARLLDMTGLAPFSARRVGRLSGGMQQKLGLACALLKSPPLLLLDEPTVGVDPVSRRELWKIVAHLVQDQKVAILVATSYLDEAEHCDRVIVLQQGQVLASGRPADFKRELVGRVFSFTPRETALTRPLQALLTRHQAVRDVTIRSGKVRCVVGRELKAKIGDLADRQYYREVTAAPPCFEDAFMDMATHPTIPRLPAHGQPGEGDDEIVIEVRDLTKTFGAFTAVGGISFNVRRGQIFGLLGPNGAGKTTTFRMLCGLTGASGGDIRIAGRNLRRSRARARSRLGYMAQSFSLYRQLSVVDNLIFYGKAYGLHGQKLTRRLDWALDMFELRDRKDLAAGALPGGFKQRLAMATAMLHEPALLFLDEPTSGADPLARREFWLRINGFAQQGVTVIVTTHFMEEAEYCDRLLIMSQGTELASGTPEEIRSLAMTPDTPDPTIDDAFVILATGNRTRNLPQGVGS